jgi:hypothetical protein
MGVYENLWNDIDRARQQELGGEKPCPSAPWFTTNLKWTGLEPNPGLRGDRQITTLAVARSAQNVQKQKISVIYNTTTP